MKYVIGIDLGTSAVKILLINQLGNIISEISKPYPIIQNGIGHKEQDPDAWVNQTIAGLTELTNSFDEDASKIEGISFSGQMHSLVLLDKDNNPLRNAILWNDTRTTSQCEKIHAVVGKKQLLEITKNPALEGFTLPKILWVKENEPDIFAKAKTFLLPKDYVRFRLTNKLNMDFSDAAGTLLLDANCNQWSKTICNLLDIDINICPPLVASHEVIGHLSDEITNLTGLNKHTKIIAGAADNACGAIGAGVLENGKTLCSIGTSGVILTYEDNSNKNYNEKIHLFHHGAPNASYRMGVTLSAGHSLTWFKETFAKDESYEELLHHIDTIPIGSSGLLFTPYLAGERTPHVDSIIRASFIGMDSAHEKVHFTKAVLEGITFSLRESIDILRNDGKLIDTIISIGGGAKNDTWLQMQADIFNATIVKPANEQGPGMGAAMLAAFGCNWFDSLQACADTFLNVDYTFEPIEANVIKYDQLFKIYQQIYYQTKSLNKALLDFQE